MEPRSCDTFVVLPSLTSHGGLCFGKNSDRPQDEVQELLYVPSQENSGSKLQCTYIEIDQVSQTNAVILSKPAWMWGAEMGANEHGVCIGNEAVCTKLMNKEEDLKEKLLGMDLVRLGLERAKSADEAVTVITQLLEKYGQGGPCSDTQTDFTYHNSFLIADRKEAWVLETAGSLWAAEKVTEGCRNISNNLSIGTKIDRKSDSLEKKAQDAGVWDGAGEFNFSTVFGEENSDATKRAQCGGELLKKLSSSNKFSAADMMNVLRDKESGICRGRDANCPTASSQVSVLFPPNSGKPDCHWFTATPDPTISVFKPFIFTPHVQISNYTVSPTIENDPAKRVPRFETTVDRAHMLYKLHESATSKGTEGKDEVISKLRALEQVCVSEVDAFLEKFEQGQPTAEFDELLKDIVETEVKFYKWVSGH